MTSNHRDDDSASKLLELVITELQTWPKFEEEFVTLLLRQEGQIPTDLGHLKRLVYPFDRTVAAFD